MIRGGYHVYHYGEEVAAVVAVRPGALLDAGSLRTWAKERLPAYKVLRLVAVVDELLKGPTGKILKRALDPATLKLEASPRGVNA